MDLTGGQSALSRCTICEENLGIVVSSESFFGCALCGADLSSYNMVDAGLPGLRTGRIARDRRAIRLGGLCFSCLVRGRAEDMFVGLSRDLLGLMYWVVITDCIHDPMGGYSA